MFILLRRQEKLYIVLTNVISQLSSMFSPFDSALLLDFHILYIYAVFSNLQNSFSALFLFNVNKQGIYEIPKYILLQKCDVWQDRYYICVFYLSSFTSLLGSSEQYSYELYSVSFYFQKQLDVMWVFGSKLYLIILLCNNY